MLQTETQLAYAQLHVVVASSLFGRNAVLSFTLRHSCENNWEHFCQLESFQILNFEQFHSELEKLHATKLHSQAYWIFSNPWELGLSVVIKINQSWFKSK